MILVEVAGHLGADPEERFTSNGKRVITLRIAARIRQGGQDETVWWRVNIWNDRFDKMMPFLKKGSPVIVIGEMSKPETYTSTRDGSVQISLSMTAEIVKFSPFGRPDRPEAGSPEALGAKPAYNNQYAGAGASVSGAAGGYSPAGGGASLGGNAGGYGEPDGGFAGDDLPF